MKRPYIIGITGGSGSGKTTFINKLREAFSESELCIISQDDYYKPREQQAQDASGIHNFDLPGSFDIAAFIRDVQGLIEGQAIHRQEYTFNNSSKSPRDLYFRPAPLVLLEGIFVFHYEAIWEMLDLTLFLHAKEDIKIVRRIERDRIERNYPLEDVLYRYVHHVAPTFEQYIKPYREKADLVINNNDKFDAALEVLIGFLRGRC